MASDAVSFAGLNLRSARSEASAARLARVQLIPADEAHIDGWRPVQPQTWRGFHQCGGSTSMLQSKPCNGSFHAAERSPHNPSLLLRGALSRVRLWGQMNENQPRKETVRSIDTYLHWRLLRHPSEIAVSLPTAAPALWSSNSAVIMPVPRKQTPSPSLVMKNFREKGSSVTQRFAAERCRCCCCAYLAAKARQSCAPKRRVASSAQHTMAASLLSSVYASPTSPDCNQVITLAQIRQRSRLHNHNV